MMERGGWRQNSLMSNSKAIKIVIRVTWTYFVYFPLRQWPDRVFFCVCLVYKYQFYNLIYKWCIFTWYMFCFIILFFCLNIPFYFKEMITLAGCFIPWDTPFYFTFIHVCVLVLWISFSNDGRKLLDSHLTGFYEAHLYAHL